MVPGMTERDQMATQARNHDWLADATIGPARIACSSCIPSLGLASRPELPLGIWRRGLLSARVFGKRITLIQPGTPRAATDRVSAPAG